MNLPAIPESVPSMLGPVPIVFVPDLKDDDGSALMGRWQPEKRRILLCANMHPTTTLTTLVHEWVHLSFWDCGTGLSMKDEERAADAIASNVVQFLLNRSPTTERADVERLDGMTL